MKDVNTLLAQLDEVPEFEWSAQLAREAAERIRYLSSEMANAIEVANRLQRDRIILRAALVSIVGVDSKSGLEDLSKALVLMKELGSGHSDIDASLAGVQALLETL